MSNEPETCAFCSQDLVAEDQLFEAHEHTIKQAEEIERLTAEGRKLELQQRIHVSTIRDLQCGAMSYMAFPYDSEKEKLNSAVAASLCIVPLEDAPVSGSQALDIEPAGDLSRCSECGKEEPEHALDCNGTHYPVDDSRQEPK